MSTFVVREVRAGDIPLLEEFEKKVWGGLSTAVLTADILGEWLRAGSPFFLLAEADGEIAGYFYGQFCGFSLETIDDFTSPRVLGKSGYTTPVHAPNGNSVIGITIASCIPGAGKALNKEVYKRVHLLKKDFYIGHSRLSGLAAYWESLTPSARERAQAYGESTVALWYAHQCMKLVDGKIWEDLCTPAPTLDLPAPTVPDGALSFNAKGTDFGLLRVVDNYMIDPESKNFAAFLAHDAR